jgi:mono/diheme cytochrome c family protein/rhodanese-related sulfurtransferase
MGFLPTLRASSAIMVALALIGCAKKNGTHTEPSPAASEQGTPKPPSQAATGEALYQKYCKLCHAADATGYAADNAPSLVSQNFLRSATDDFIAQGIRMGRPGTAMAAYGMLRGGPLDDSQIAAIVAFLRSKGPYPVPVPDTPLVGNGVRGAALFAEHCLECHGDETKRGTAPSLHNPEFLANARPGFLRFAIEHGRPPTPMPAFSGKLSNDEIGDLVSFLHRLAPRGPASPPVLNPTVPDDLPVVINPKGSHPNFTLRDDRYVSAEQVKRALDDKRRIVILDARPASEWIQFRIPGAISFPHHQSANIERIPNDGTWVVAYCACPHHASGEVVDALRKRNYPKTAVLDEGILVWRNRGYPLAGEASGKAQGQSVRANVQ